MNVLKSVNNSALASYYHFVKTIRIRTQNGLCSVGIIIFGAIVAGVADLAFDPHSYAVVFTANICTAIYLASIARVGSILSFHVQLFL